MNFNSSSAWRTLLLLNAILVALAGNASAQALGDLPVDLPNVALPNNWRDRQYLVVDQEKAHIFFTAVPSTHEIVVFEPLVITVSLRNSSSLLRFLPWDRRDQMQYQESDCADGPWNTIACSPTWYEEPIHSSLEMRIYGGQYFQWDEVLFWRKTDPRVMREEEAKLFREQPYVFATPGKRWVRVVLEGPMLSRAHILYSKPFEVTVKPAEEPRHRRAAELIRSPEVGKCLSRFTERVAPEALERMRQLLYECPTSNHADYVAFHIARDRWLARQQTKKADERAELEAQMVHYLNQVGTRIPSLRHRAAVMTASTSWGLNGIRDHVDLLRVKRELDLDCPLSAEFTHPPSFPNFTLEELRRNVRSQLVYTFEDGRLDQIVDCRRKVPVELRSVVASISGEINVPLDFRNCPDLTIIQPGLLRKCALREFMAIVAHDNRYWVRDGEGYKLLKDEPIDYKRYWVENPVVDNTLLPTFPPSGRKQ